MSDLEIRGFIEGFRRYLRLPKGQQYLVEFHVGLPKSTDATPHDLAEAVGKLRRLLADPKEKS